MKLSLDTELKTREVRVGETTYELRELTGLQRNAYFAVVFRCLVFPKIPWWRRLFVWLGWVAPPRPGMTGDDLADLVERLVSLSIHPPVSQSTLLSWPASTVQHLGDICCELSSIGVSPKK